MLFPVRCYTCNTVLAHLHPEYDRKVKSGEHAHTALGHLNVHRMCCRRMFLGYVDIISDQLHNGNVDIALDRGGTVLQRRATHTRMVGCD
jgi:DNA-directed RNA polymerase subunit N (RpoN/RPB10)